MNPSSPSDLKPIRNRLLLLLAGVGAPDSVASTLAPAVRVMDDHADALVAGQTWQPSRAEHGNLAGRPVTPAEFYFSLYYFDRVVSLARSWRCPFSRHAHSGALLERITAGLAFGEPFVRPAQTRDGSWYYWDIGCPSSLSYVLLLCGDALPAALRDRLLEDLHGMPSKVFELDRDRGIVRPLVTSGANNMDILFVALLRSLVTGDPRWLSSASAQLPIAMKPNPDGEGLQKDWSYHFHGHGVNAGYGLTAIGAQGLWIYLTQDTPWQVSDELRELHVGMVREFFALNAWRGRFSPYILDRGIAFPGSIHVPPLLTALLYGCHSRLPAADHAVFTEAVADYRQGPGFVEWRKANVDGDFRASLLLRQAEEQIGHEPAPASTIRYFPDSEYLVVRQPAWFAAVRMSSGRTSTWKSQLGSHTRGSSGAEFSIALMTDGREFDNTTISTMNWKRLMGVTRCDAIEPPPEGYGQSAFVGGLAGPEFGVVGVQYLLAPAGQDTLRGNKSLFATPDALVLLGTGIRCDSTEPVCTTLFQAPLIEGASYRRGGVALDVQQDGAWELDAGERVFLRNVWVRLLTPARLTVETREGSFADMNLPEKSPALSQGKTPYNEIHRRRWVYLIAHHGARPSDARYGAILWPGQTVDPAPSADSFQIVHEPGLHRVTLRQGGIGGEVRFPGDWRKKIGLSYWGAEQHQWGSIARWTPGDDDGHANMEITAPRRFVRSPMANTEIFLPDGFEQENVTLKTYEGRPFPANLLPLSADGQIRKLRVRRTS